MSGVRLIFEKQWFHAFALVLLLTGEVQAFKLNRISGGAFCGISTAQCFWKAIGPAITHYLPPLYNGTGTQETS